MGTNGVRVELVPPSSSSVVDEDVKNLLLGRNLVHKLVDVGEFLHVGRDRGTLPRTESVELFCGFFAFLGRSGRNVNLQQHTIPCSSEVRSNGFSHGTHRTFAPFFTNPVAIFPVRKRRVAHVSSRAGVYPKARRGERADNRSTRTILPMPRLPPVTSTTLPLTPKRLWTSKEDMATGSRREVWEFSGPAFQRCKRSRKLTRTDAGPESKV
jgi:hypothetical protein